MTDKPSQPGEPFSIVAGFAHEMRSAISGASYALDILLSRKDNTLTAAKDDPAHLLDVLMAIRESLETGQNIVQEAMACASLGRIVPADESVSLSDLLTKLRVEFDDSWRERGVACDVDLPSDLHLPMKEAHAYAVVRNLMANARDAIAARDDGPTGGRIKVSAQATGTVTTLTIEDDGVGIPESIRSQIFTPFFTTKGHNGTGVGLGFCRQLIGLYGGHLHFEEASPHGTIFKVTLERKRT